VARAKKDRHPQAIDRALEDFLRFAPSYGGEPTPLQIDQIRTYVVELLRWNEKINLTAARDPDTLLLRHVLDSLVPLARLAGMSRLLDVGPGGGLPGIPIKIFRPGLQVVLLEARRKKASFNQHVVDRLGLDGIEVVWSRLGDEEISERYAGRPFDGIITRAALPGVRVLRAGKALLRPGGSVVLMKGSVDRASREELQQEAARQGLGLVQLVPYRLPGLRRTRNLVLIR
jgi:16S rRNA (guanine527-N7)-methyltransferase